MVILEQNDAAVSLLCRLTLPHCHLVRLIWISVSLRAGTRSGTPWPLFISLRMRWRQGWFDLLQFFMIQQGKKCAFILFYVKRDNELKILICKLSLVCSIWFCSKNAIILVRLRTDWKVVWALRLLPFFPWEYSCVDCALQDRYLTLKSPLLLPLERGGGGLDGAKRRNLFDICSLLRE